MRKRVRETAQAPTGTIPPYAAAISLLLGTGVVLVSTVFSGGAVDAFRIPKETAFRADAILVLALSVFAITSARGGWHTLVRNVSKVELVLCAGTVCWIAVTTLTSTNRLLSLEAFVTVIASVVLYLGTRIVAPHQSMMMLDVCLLPAILNAVMAMVQEWGIWNPFTFPQEISGHTQTIGLMGHPNDVGTFIVAPCVASIIAASTQRGKRQWFYILTSLVLTGGLIASASRTSLIAFVVSIVVFALVQSRKRALVTLVLLIAVSFAAAAASTLVRKNFEKLVRAAEERRYDLLFSERLVPFLAAIEMIRAHPVFGVGPGCFKFHYMDERLALASKYPESMTRGWPQNFGETHNDYLQTAAETGLPGYGLLVAGMVVLAYKPKRRTEEKERSRKRRFARALKLPLLAVFALLASAQFPLQIAAPRLMLLTLAALAIGWDRDDRDDD